MLKGLFFYFVFAFFSFFSLPLLAVTTSLSSEEAQSQDFNVLDEIDPFDPQIEQKLQQFDEVYEQGSGEASHLNPANSFGSLFIFRQPLEETCVRAQCAVWIQVVKSTQTAYLFLNGRHEATWKVSSGITGRSTPNFDQHPNGRIYDRYTSSKFPGGDFRGLGNMPYAVFIRGGFAIHGTAEVNWKKLGTKASHGCIRVHPDNAFYFNRAVRQAGIENVWITVQE